MEDPIDVDVLICGAGAAGLTLAMDLARRGVSFRLIDQLDRPFAGSRGKGIQPRTQEVFEDLGIIDRIAACGSAYPPQREYRVDGSFADEQGTAVAPASAAEPYATPLLVPQFATEAVMRERLAELGHRPHYASRIDRFEQDAGGVTAWIAGPDGTQTIRCRYSIGADGGRSTIRAALGIGFPGKTLGVRAIVVDVVLDGLDRDAWHRFNEGSMERQIAFCPLPHTDLFQLQAPIPLDGDIDLSVTGLQALIDERVAGRSLVLRSVAWASAYGMNARLADRYRVGRVFLIGDAAHIHPPTGGQGLNTSVQDAYNLGWKLAATLRGAPDALLDTYEEERRMIAADMLGLSTDLLARAQRGDMRRGREVHQLDLGYCGARLSLDAPARDAALRAGDRMPDAIMPGGGRLFDLLAGPHWTLLVDEGEEARSADLTVHRLDAATFGGWDVAPGGALLIRPDGYVGAIVDDPNAAAVSAYLTGVGVARPG